jgi:hypothetical protein
MATGQIEGHQAPGIVNNGVMFVATPGNQVLAIDAKNGELLWRFVVGTASGRRQGHGRRVRRTRRSRLCCRFRRRDRQAGMEWKTGGGGSVWLTGHTIRRPTSPSGAPATGGHGWAISDRETIYFTSSTIALDIATGKIKGHFQCHPNDSWDWDEVSALIPCRLPAGRQDREGPDLCRARRLFVAARAHRRQDQFRRRQAVRERPGAPMSTRRASQAPTRRPISVPRCGEARLAAGRFQHEDPARLHTGKR